MTLFSDTKKLSKDSIIIVHSFHKSLSSGNKLVTPVIHT